MPWLHASSMIQPPTNRWFSGLAFGSPSPVFPTPYSYIQTDQGFVFGLPHVTSSRHTISGPASADIDVNVGAYGYRIAAHDLASVTIEFQNEIGRVLGRAVLAEGVPYVSYTAEIAHDVTLSEAFSMEYESCATAHVEGSHYGLVTTGAFSARSIRLQAGQYVSLIAFPQFTGESPAQVEREVLRIARHATFPVLRTEVTAQVLSDEVVTSIRYVARENGPVAVVRLPHHEVREPLDTLGTYATVSGTAPLVSAKVLTWRTPRVEPRVHLDLTRVAGDRRATLAAAAVQDIGEVPRAPEDTYFGGKALFRDANLLDLATQLSVPGADAFGRGLEERFLEWFQAAADSHAPRTFFYDDVWSGVVGREASFGTDLFNDHHFHWGYFLHVAAVLGERNPQLLEQVRESVDALAFDIATPVPDTEFPMLRVFDVYKGHSWASGTAPFDEGNNQESSSEAVNAWNALGAWGKLTGRTWLYELSVWLLSLEACSARTYWTNFDQSDPVRTSYRHSVIPLVWGAKHDYATWFSGEQSAMLGMAVLPMAPVADYLGGDSDRIMQNLEEIVGFFGDYDQVFGDYLLMYRALAGTDAAEQAWHLAQDIPAERIDDGNSLTYVLAWIAEHLV
jgi:endoglucanase Acf2